MSLINILDLENLNLIFNQIQEISIKKYNKSSFTVLNCFIHFL